MEFVGNIQWIYFFIQTSILITKKPSGFEIFLKNPISCHFSLFYFYHAIPYLLPLYNRIDSQLSCSTSMERISLLTSQLTPISSSESRLVSLVPEIQPCVNICNLGIGTIVNYDFVLKGRV